MIDEEIFGPTLERDDWNSEEKIASQKGRSTLTRDDQSQRDGQLQRGTTLWRVIGPNNPWSEWTLP